MSTDTVHGSAVLVEERGVLIRGPSGSGKSSLVLQLLTKAPGRAWLIADDRVILSPHHGRVIAAAPPELAGRIEIRGQGIRQLAFVSPAVLHLVVDLVGADSAPRMPEADETVTELAGARLPYLAVPATDGAAAERIRAKLFFQADAGLL